MIWTFDELPEEQAAAAGGKGRVLARLYRAGYPVPAGFVITAQAFDEGGLRAGLWDEVSRQAAALQGREGRLLAVRSSALAEDSAAASFAGEFESVLGVSGDEELRAAIAAVYASRQGERAYAYARAQGLDAATPMAVVVQEMVPAELAGVLFTADPLTGSRSVMAGNFVRGLGEQLVSGAATGESFTLAWPKGAYDGPSALRPYARRLFRLGRRLALALGGPQDVEWAIAGGRVWLLQARPITTMQPYDPRTGIWNDSRGGDYFWSNSNFGEALPGVMTPLTWSVVHIYIDETFQNPLATDAPFMGNVGGRLYANLTLFASMMQALGFSRERANRESQEFFGELPGDLEIPILPVTRLEALRAFVPYSIRALRRRRRNLHALPAFTAALPARTAALREAISAVDSPAGLLAQWQEQFEPLLRRTYQMMQAGTSRYENAYRPLRRKLAVQVGEEDANLLLSGVSVDGEALASLGPLLGLWQVARGEMARDAYLQSYGHRGVHEFELSWPRPAEEPAWLERQLQTLDGTDVPGLLARRRAQKEAAWQRYRERFPGEAQRMARKLDQAAAAARAREAIRSETVRLLAAARAFAQRAAVLSGLGDGVFFLTLAELLALLGGEAPDLSQIAIRRTAHEMLSSLPPYPPLINGRFDPVTWAAAPNRRPDLYDAHAGVSTPARLNGHIQGLPASAGVVEGVVRRLESAEQGHLLQEGEILVAMTTNVGWTPFFPRAAAVVTDVGAPLSHAAIVARELGIPAVVGTGDATSRLRSGDRVRVDGARGTVEVVARAAIEP